MDRLTLINRIKYNKKIYYIYNYLGSKLVAFLKLFLRTDNNLIVFASFGGKKFDDSPRVIYDAILSDNRFDNIKLVWAFIHPKDFDIPRGKKVKIDSFAYYKFLLRARIWITNSSMTRGLSISGINTFELNTWHGSAIKKMGSDIIKGNTSFRIINRKTKGKKAVKVNKGVMLAQSQFDVEVFSRAFHKSHNYFRVIGLPRNDMLVHVTKEITEQTRAKLGIPKEKVVILYAPTFREYEKDKANNCVMTPPINLQKWKKQLGNNYVFLMRAHYEVMKVMDFIEDDFFRNVSNYPNLNELMIASDMLISDYSSIIFDYSILEKPILCYAYDYERYKNERGMYFDIREALKCEDFDNEDSIIEEILHMDVENRINVTKSFKEKYIEESGYATSKCLNIIYTNLSKQ